MKQFEENQKIQRQLAIQNHVNRNRKIIRFRFLSRLNRMKFNHKRKKKTRQFLMKLLHYQVN
jgi:hypothetical protein